MVCTAMAMIIATPNMVTSITHPKDNIKSISLPHLRKLTLAELTSVVIALVT